MGEDFLLNDDIEVEILVEDSKRVELTLLDAFFILLNGTKSLEEAELSVSKLLQHTTNVKDGSVPPNIVMLGTFLFFLANANGSVELLHAGACLNLGLAMGNEKYHKFLSPKCTGALHTVEKPKDFTMIDKYIAQDWLGDPNVCGFLVKIIHGKISVEYSPQFEALFPHCIAIGDPSPSTHLTIWQRCLADDNIARELVPSIVDSIIYAKRTEFKDLGRFGTTWGVDKRLVVQALDNAFYDCTFAESGIAFCPGNIVYLKIQFKDLRRRF